MINGQYGEILTDLRSGVFTPKELREVVEVYFEPGGAQAPTSTGLGRAEVPRVGLAGIVHPDDKLNPDWRKVRSTDADSQAAYELTQGLNGYTGTSLVDRIPKKPALHSRGPGGNALTIAVYDPEHPTEVEEVVFSFVDELYVPQD